MNKPGYKRESKLAVSVVTVLAAFAASAGCDDTKGPVECPAEQPKEGDPCDTDEPCGYQRCQFDQSPTRQALCEKGVFRIRMLSCNPPYTLFDGGTLIDASFNDAASDASSVKDGS